MSALLNLCDINQYEGQAAMLLEQKAREYFIVNSLKSITQCYTFTFQDGKILFDKFLSELTFDIAQNESVTFIAAKFHVSLIYLIKKIAKPYSKIAFSGGVFQNAILVDLAIEHLSEDHKLYFHNQLPPNDENISVGQVGYWIATGKHQSK
ncbi:MAG TPA: hypothetical protein PKD85_14640 [Saprospiraceae bacterium]|nr:hypothetical protein [Saprospiraceae bacterium]